MVNQGEVVQQYGVTNATNFNQTGTFVFNNPGYEQDAWYLVYDGPGMPAQAIKLAFTSQSSCYDVHMMPVSCTLGVAFDSGVRISVQGVQSGGTVTVQRLTRLQ